jgi:hypothetical protein
LRKKDEEERKEKAVKLIKDAIYMVPKDPVTLNGGMFPGKAKGFSNFLSGKTNVNDNLNKDVVSEMTN